MQSKKIGEEAASEKVNSELSRTAAALLVKSVRVGGGFGLAELRSAFESRFLICKQAGLEHFLPAIQHKD